MSERNYLLQIAIGPVQDFIAAARRTHDLWMGSRMLSELRTGSWTILSNFTASGRLSTDVRTTKHAEPRPNFWPRARTSVTLALPRARIAWPKARWTDCARACSKMARAFPTRRIVP